MNLSPHFGTLLVFVNSRLENNLPFFTSREIVSSLRTCVLENTQKYFNRYCRKNIKKTLKEDYPFIFVWNILGICKSVCMCTHNFSYVGELFLSYVREIHDTTSNTVTYHGPLTCADSDISGKILGRPGSSWTERSSCFRNTSPLHWIAVYHPRCEGICKRECAVGHGNGNVCSVIKWDRDELPASGIANGDGSQSTTGMLHVEYSVNRV